MIYNFKNIVLPSHLSLFQSSQSLQPTPSPKKQTTIRSPHLLLWESYPLFLPNFFKTIHPKSWHLLFLLLLFSLSSSPQTQCLHNLCSDSRSPPPTTVSLTTRTATRCLQPQPIHRHRPLMPWQVSRWDREPLPIYWHPWVADLRWRQAMVEHLR